MDTTNTGNRTAPFPASSNDSAPDTASASASVVPKTAPHDSPLNTVSTVEDISMADAPAEQVAHQTTDQTPAPAAITVTKRSRTASPDRSTNAYGSGEAGKKLPTEHNPSGDTVRRYLNGQIATVLIEGLKSVAQVRPRDPVRFLGEFLINRANEAEAFTRGTS